MNQNDVKKITEEKEVEKFNGLVDATSDFLKGMFGNVMTFTKKLTGKEPEGETNTETDTSQK